MARVRLEAVKVAWGRSCRALQRMQTGKGSNGRSDSPSATDRKYSNTPIKWPGDSRITVAIIHKFQKAIQFQINGERFRQPIFFKRKQFDLLIV